jgi:hypothetical protein
MVLAVSYFELPNRFLLLLCISLPAVPREGRRLKLLQGGLKVAKGSESEGRLFRTTNPRMLVDFTAK